MPQPRWLRIEGARQNNLEEHLARHPPRSRSPWSPECRAPASPRWPSTPCSRKASGATSSRCPRTPACSSSGWTGPTWTASRISGPPSRSSRRIPCGRPGPRWEPPPSSTTTSASFGRIGRVHCPRCGTEARSDAVDTVSDGAGARASGRAGPRSASRCPRPRGRTRARPTPRSSSRGFARVKVGGDVRRPGRRHRAAWRCAAPEAGAARPGRAGPRDPRGRVRRRVAESLEAALAEGRAGRGGRAGSRDRPDQPPVAGARAAKLR